MIRSTLLAIALIASSPLTAVAWDPLGHMLVGQIAYDRLTPAARAQVDAALARFNQQKIVEKKELDAPYDAVIAPCWMDDIRALPALYNFGVWHYVELPFTPDGMPAPPDNAGPNVIWGIRQCEGILAGKITDPNIDKDQAMVMLMHLVGDIHQPLHTTSRADDAGGNKVKLANLKDPLADLVFSKGGNLHFFWDSAYRRIYRNGDATVLYEAPLHDRVKPVAGHRAALPIVQREAAALQKKYPPARFREQGDALTWAKESHAIGYEIGYGKLPSASGNAPIRLSQSYVDAARTVAEERLVLAGYRLGNLLNQISAQPAGAPTASPTAPEPAASPVPSPLPVIPPAPSLGNPAE